jgi:photosystem II stability/assembly factor-like uncharacterized protein
MWLHRWLNRRLTKGKNSLPHNTIKFYFEHMKTTLFLLMMFLPFLSISQDMAIVTKRDGVSLRGLSVVNDQVIWASGSKGTVGLSLDGGQTWNWQVVKGFETSDFRDIEGFDGKTAVIMAIGEPAYILKTYNGGESWKIVFTDSTKGMFLDAMEFWDGGNGIVVGDPINNQIFVARTADFGTTWETYSSSKMARTETGEAMFASSGTNIRKISNLEAVVVTGGTRSRLMIHERFVDLPLLQGGSSTGANSIAFSSALPRKARMVVVGGDFTNDKSSEKNCAYSTDMGRTWKTPAIPPKGYRSCVEFIGPDRLITCGTSGVDISDDGGKTWKLISTESFHVVQKSKSGNAVYLAGSGGRIAKFRLD